ncbi:MAG: NAD(P)H-dependent oxidoreductase [Clostridia bacterium]|nr:NAD(P)H-dependent oxidoreductase [Clostridia bacterium]
MKKLLYITASTKPESSSVSKQAGRDFLTRFHARHSDYETEELDLYGVDLPEPDYRFYSGWCELVSGPEYDALNETDRHSVDEMNRLCAQFQAADAYVIAAPMWSMSFPSRLKQYLDCIMLNQRLIRLSPNGVDGLLDDKEREMLYIQSSGGVYPKLIDWKFNYGVNYCHDLFKRLGVKHFYKVLIQGTDMTDIGPAKALACSQQDFCEVLEKFCGCIQ